MHIKPRISIVLMLLLIIGLLTPVMSDKRVSVIASNEAMSAVGEIAFIRDENIWLVNPDGSDLLQLTSAGGYAEPAWSRDGKFLAFVHSFIAPDSQRAYEIGILNIENNQKTIIVPAEKIPLPLIPFYYAYYNPRWSMDDASLIYIAADNRAQGEMVHKVNINTGEKDVGFTSFHAKSIDVSPTDGRIVYHDYFNSIPNGDTLNIANPDGSQRTVLIPLVDGIYNRWPRFSPDGLDIAFVRSGWPVEFINIEVLNLESMEKTIYPVDNYPVYNDIFWAPDRSKIIYDTDQYLRFLDLSSGNISAFIRGSDPSWNWTAKSGDSISGRVTDSSSNPISGVTISAGGGYSATTDSHGNYTLTGLPAGTYTLTPSLTGYIFSPSSRTVSVPPDATGQDFVGSIIPQQLKLLFVPLNWQGSQQSFENTATTQADAFLDEVPLNACPEQALVETLSVANQNFDEFTCSINDCGLDRIRAFVRDDLEIDPANYDIIVGLAENSSCPPIAGCSNGTDTIWVTPADEIVTAHEIGHIFNLEDEYCSSQAGSDDERCNDGDIQGDGATTGDVNWLDGSLPCDCPPDGSNDSGGSPCCNFSGLNCSDVGYGICCRGNKNSSGGRSTMSYANAAGPRGFDVHDLAHLNGIPQLNCSLPDTAIETTTGGRRQSGTRIILDTNLLIHVDNSVDEGSISIKSGRPTSDSILQGLDGDYSIVIRDAKGGKLWGQGFGLYFDYTGPVFLNIDYSGISYEALDVSFRIPYELDMHTLELYYGDELIFSKTLPVKVWNWLPILFYKR